MASKWHSYLFGLTDLGVRWFGMIAFSEWFPNALVGVTFMSLGLVKIYGWRKGIVGGGGKSVSCRLMGRCPSWSKPVNIGVIILFLAIGIVNLGILVLALLTK